MRLFFILSEANIAVKMFYYAKTDAMSALLYDLRIVTDAENIINRNVVKE